jgi:chemotaxis protein methyltransferase CheR
MALDSLRDDCVLSESLFRMFQAFFRDYCGLYFGDDSRFLLEKRLARRIAELGVGSFSAYHYLLRKDAGGEEELATIIDMLTTNETYFFREFGQLRALVDEVLPELLARYRERRPGPLSIWSAGCSSGEEPYSIVMLAREAGLEPGRDFRVYASDISRQMLHKARRGVYRQASFRETDPLLRKRYFEEEDGHWRISDEVKRHVVFTRVNLIDRSRISILGTMDVILCRNVIIYFDLETKKQVIGTFAEKLHPGGYLLLGHSESLINVSSAFQLRHLRNDLVYRRPLPGEGVPDPWDAAARAAIRSVEREGGGR